MVVEVGAYTQIIKMLIFFKFLLELFFVTNYSLSKWLTSYTSLFVLRLILLSFLANLTNISSFQKSFGTLDTFRWRWQTDHCLNIVVSICKEPE